MNRNALSVAALVTFVATYPPLVAADQTSAQNCNLGLAPGDTARFVGLSRWTERLTSSPLRDQSG